MIYDLIRRYTPLTSGRFRYIRERFRDGYKTDGRIVANSVRGMVPVVITRIEILESGLICMDMQAEYPRKHDSFSWMWHGDEDRLGHCFYVEGMAWRMWRRVVQRFRRSTWV